MMSVSGSTRKIDARGFPFVHRLCLECGRTKLMSRYWLRCEACKDRRRHPPAPPVSRFRAACPLDSATVVRGPDVILPHTAECQGACFSSFAGSGRWCALWLAGRLRWVVLPCCRCATTSVTSSFIDLVEQVFHRRLMAEIRLLELVRARTGLPGLSVFALRLTYGLEPAFLGFNGEAYYSLRDVAGRVPATKRVCCRLCRRQGRVGQRLIEIKRGHRWRVVCANGCRRDVTPMSPAPMPPPPVPLPKAQRKKEEDPWLRQAATLLREINHHLRDPSHPLPMAPSAFSSSADPEASRLAATLLKASAC